MLDHIKERNEVEQFSVSVVVKPGTDRYSEVRVEDVGGWRVVYYNTVLHVASQLT